MINHDAFPAEPWVLRETALDLDVLAQAESLFALSNGHLGWRGNLDEGEPHGLPGTYLNGVHELRPLPSAEPAYGLPEASQTVVNVTNGKLIRLFVDGEPFDIRYGTLLSHERLLDFRAGTLSREADWVSPAGRRVRVTSTRLVSFTQRAVGAIRYTVEPVDGDARIVVRSELVANEPLPPATADPRAGAPTGPLLGEDQLAGGAAVSLVHRTARSRLRIGAAMDHVLRVPAPATVDSATGPDSGAVTVTAALARGQRLELVKFVAHGWSGRRPAPAVREQVRAALSGACRAGWEALLAEQRAYLDDFWDRADVAVEGDAEIQQAARFALFHVLQAGARTENRPIPAKGLTGPGYDGHTFWDSEIFVLPVLTWTAPSAAASALRWRHRTLATAVTRAQQLGFTGAAFAWRTITGEECSGYWPAGTAAFHVNADIAHAVTHYVEATGDDVFAREVGIELLVATARLWHALGHHDPTGRFHIDGVTGPDEYSALADDNVYTNLMARRNLQAAASAVTAHPDRAAALGVAEKEVAGWRDAAAAMHVPYDEALGVHPASAGFTHHQRWDFARVPAARYPLMLYCPYVDLYRKQVVKQADLVLAMHLCGEEFTPGEKARNFHYYEALTVRDSSLSASTQAVLAAEVGHLDLALDYLTESALIDLWDLENNSRDGVHIASLAGTWVALVSGFGGLRQRDGVAGFSPRLPAGITGLAFTITLRGQRLRVRVGGGQARYELADGPPLTITHEGARVRLRAGEPELRPLATPPRLARPSQPPGREPARRDAASRRAR